MNGREDGRREGVLNDKGAAEICIRREGRSSRVDETNSTMGSTSSSSTYGACVISVPDGQMATLSWQLKYSSGVLGKLIGGALWTRTGQEEGGAGYY